MGYVQQELFQFEIPIPDSGRLESVKDTSLRKVKLIQKHLDDLGQMWLDGRCRRQVDQLKSHLSVLKHCIEKT